MLNIDALDSFLGSFLLCLFSALILRKKRRYDKCAKKDRIVSPMRSKCICSKIGVIIMLVTKRNSLLGIPFYNFGSTGGLLGESCAYLFQTYTRVS